jgi:hypothetical protein
MPQIPPAAAHRSKATRPMSYFSSAIRVGAAAQSRTSLVGIGKELLSPVAQGIRAGATLPIKHQQAPSARSACRIT